MNVRPTVATVFASLAVLLFGVDTASAQTMEFGEDEAEETMTFGEEDSGGEKGNEKSKSQPKKGAASGQAAQFIKEGKSLYKKKKYDQASLIFYKVMNQKSISSEAAIPEARYELGKTLFRMNLYQGALSQFGKIVESGESHPYYVPALNGLLSLSEVIPGDPSLRKYLASYADRFPQQVPEKYRDRYAYLVGRHFYSQPNYQNAIKMLKYVSRRSDFYAKSRYILGTTHVAMYSAKPAVRAFKQTLRYLNAQKESGSLDERGQKVMELTNLAMARVFYSTGDYGTSLKYYDKVGRGSPRWAQALFESSWAYFQIDKYNKALGNLHSLNSPFFAGSYFPEGPILAAVIYFENCKFDRVRHELEEFEYAYEPFKDDMQSVLDQHTQPSQMFEWYKRLKKGEVDYTDRVYKIIEAAVDDKQVQTKFELVQLINDEIAKIKSMPGSWKNSPLGQSLTQEATLAQSFAVEDAGALARQRLKRRVRKLTDLINQKKKIKFEVARAEKRGIQDDIRAGKNVKGNAREAGKLKVDGEEMYWKFNGEYWRDEIGKYVFNIGSKCQR